MSRSLTKSGNDLANIEFLPDNKTHTHRFEINSETSNRVYIVAQRKTSLRWECSCFGWIRHRRCKHLEAMGALLKQIGGGTTPSKKLKAK